MSAYDPKQTLDHGPNRTTPQTNIIGHTSAVPIGHSGRYAVATSSRSFLLALPIIVISGNPHPALSQTNPGAPTVPSLKGIVAPARSYDIAPPFDGQVIKIHFVPGEFVEKGALLFTLDTTKENLELERDQARLLRAEAQLRIAEQVKAVPGATYENQAALSVLSVVRSIGVPLGVTHPTKPNISSTLWRSV